MSNSIAFRLDYTDAATGESVSVTVDRFDVARRLAPELARASGRRAIVTRIRTTDRPRPLWTVHLVDTETGEVRVLWDRLTKAEVLARWKLWREQWTQCVLLAWPDGMPCRPWTTVESQSGK